MAVLTLDKIIFRNNDSYLKMYKGSELIAEVESTPALDYLTFTALQSGSTVKFNSTRDVVTSEYSTDGGNTWTSGNGVTVTLSKVGDKVLYRGVTSTLSTDPDTAFILVGQIKASGSVMSMINKNPEDTSLSGLNYAFAYYFNYQSALKDISELILPATTLSDSCYNHMFYNCTGITTIPANFLPATTLSDSCYRYMFGSCNGLTTVPANLLPATTLANSNYCYANMFNGCTSLTSTPNLPATTLTSYCYQGMFTSCWSLTSTPNLPATTSTNYCYNNMFYGCTGLTTVPANLLPAKTLATNCYANMFQDCTGLTTAPNLPSTALKNYCYANMFSGCTSLTSTPNLPATTLVKCCYQYMFSGCTNLNRVVTYARSISATNCLRNWLSSVSSTGDFYNLGGATYSSDANGIPTGWTVHTAL